MVWAEDFVNSKCSFIKGAFEKMISNAAEAHVRKDKIVTRTQIAGEGT